MVGVALEACENCGRKIGKLETPMVWQEQVVCRECHKVLRGGGHGGDLPDPATAGEAPFRVATGAAISGDPEEQVLLRGRTSMVPLAAKIALGLALAIILGIAVRHASGPMWASLLLACLIATVLSALLIGEWILTSYTLTSRKIVWNTGLLTRTHVEIRLKKVNNIEITRSVLGMALNYGTIVVYSGNDGPEALCGIVGPTKVYAAIQEALAGKES